MKFRSGNSERVRECRASHRRQRLRRDITTIEISVSPLRTLSEFGFRLAILFPGRCPGLEFANAFGVFLYMTSALLMSTMLMPLCEGINQAAAILISNASLAIFLLMFTSSVPRSSSISDNHDAAFWLLSSAAIFPSSLTRSLLTIDSAGRPS